MSQTPYLRGQIEDVEDTSETDARRFGRVSSSAGRGPGRPGPVRVRSRFAVTSAASAAATRANANGQVHGGTVAKFTPLKMSGAASAAEKAMKRAAAYQNKNRSESAERRGGAKPTLNSGPGPATRRARRCAARRRIRVKGEAVRKSSGGARVGGRRRGGEGGEVRAAEYKKRRRRGPPRNPPPGRRRRRRRGDETRGGVQGGTRREANEGSEPGILGIVQSSRGRLSLGESYASFKASISRRIRSVRDAVVSPVARLRERVFHQSHHELLFGSV